MRLSARLALPLLVLAVVALVLSGCPKPAAKSAGSGMSEMPKDSGKKMADTGGDEIVIGAIFSVTGTGAPLGEPEKATAEMVAKQINDAGGIDGKQVKLIIEDDATADDKAVMAAKKLIEQDKVMAIVGPTMSGTTLAIVDTCEQAEVPLVSCAASVKITSPVKKWVFSTAQNDVLAVQRLLDYLKAEKITKVALICDSNAFGQSGAEQLKKQLPAAGVTITGEEKFDNKATDMTAQLTKLKGAQPQAIICWGTNPAPAIVAKNAKALKLDAKIIMSHGIANKKFIELAGDAAEGVVFPAGKLLVVGELPDSNAQKQVLQDYAKAFEASAGKPGNTFGGHAYDALQLVINALKGGAADRAAIRDAIEKTQGHVGIGGTFNLSDKDHNGLTKDAFALVTIKGGAWTQVK
jgi:branched-chain amino acid transport system substrate-binding protein